MESILQGCRDNNRKSQHKLYSLYYHKLVAVAMKYSNGSSDVDDLVQEAFITIFDNIHTFDYSTPSKLGSWMCTIVKNKTLDMYRNNKKVRYVELSDDLFKEYDTESFYELFMDDIPKIIDSLGPKYRKVVTMYYFEDKKHNEIASMLGISLSSSKLNLLRGKIMMKKTLSKLHPNL